MPVSKKSLCIFTHYSEYKDIPQYVVLYANELSLYFDEVIVAANERNLITGHRTFNKNVSIQFFKNEGYDLGLFYKVFRGINISEYYQIGCVNDSNILFNKLQLIFEWSQNSNSDFWGLIDSHEKPWFSTHQDNFHIQSHFIIFNKFAINYLPGFFDLIDIQKIFNEKDPRQLRRLVIDQWEIGLSQFLLNKGLKSASYINSLNFNIKHKSKGKNITHSLYNELIAEGYPLIKKKVVLKKSWRSFIEKKESWENAISDYACSDWNISLVIEELNK